MPLIERELSVAVPTVIAVGEPGLGYPERWSVTRYLEGRLPTVAADRVPPEGPRHGLADDLARLVGELHAIEVPDAALRDEELTWYRGGPLSEVDDSFRRSVAACRELDGLDLDLDAAVRVWDQVLEATRDADPTLPGTTATCSPRTCSFATDGSARCSTSAPSEWAIRRSTWSPPGRCWTPRAALRSAAPSTSTTRPGSARGGGRSTSLSSTFPYYWDTMPARCADRLAMARAVLETG